MTDQLTTYDPATDEIIETFPVDDDATVAEAVDRARVAARWWDDVGADVRRQRMLAWKGVVTRRMDELAQLVHRENGKPVDDALLEILATIDHLDWAAKHAQRVLRRRWVRTTLLTSNQTASLEYLPLGVVGVIGPWNFPVFTPMGSIVYALAAGNAVVFKPSELTPAVGAWLVRTFGDVVPEQPVLQLVTGDGSDRHRAVPRRRRQAGVHRLDGHRQAGHGGLRGDADARPARVRRQGRDGHRRGRRPRLPPPTRPRGARSPTPVRPASGSSACTSTRPSMTTSSHG